MTTNKEENSSKLPNWKWLLCLIPAIWLRTKFGVGLSVGLFIMIIGYLKLIRPKVLDRNW